MFLGKDTRDEAYVALSEAAPDVLAKVNILCLTATFSGAPAEKRLIENTYKFSVYDYKPDGCPVLKSQITDQLVDDATALSFIQRLRLKGTVLCHIGPEKVGNADPLAYARFKKT